MRIARRTPSPPLWERVGVGGNALTLRGFHPPPSSERSRSRNPPPSRGRELRARLPAPGYSSRPKRTERRRPVSGRSFMSAAGSFRRGNRLAARRVRHGQAALFSMRVFAGWLRQPRERAWPALAALPSSATFRSRRPRSRELPATSLFRRGRTASHPLANASRSQISRRARPA